MTTFCKVAIVAVLAMATTELSLAQDFSQLPVAGPSVKASDEVAQAVYAGLSDMEDDSVKAVAYESISDNSRSAASAHISDATVVAIPADNIASVGSVSDLSGGISDGGVSQVSLFGPSCGVAGCAAGPTCGLPGYPSCGVADPACGLPMDPGCGLPMEPACGLPGSSCSGGLLSGLFGGGGGCDDACDGGCDGNGSCGPTCGSLCTRNCMSCCGVGTHYSRVYGGALYLRARNAEVPYAVGVDGPIVAGQPTPIQIGNVGLLDPDYELGYFGGLNLALDTVSSIDVRFTMFESDTEGETSAVAPNALRSLATHPSTASAAQDALSSLAGLDIDFTTIDVTYRHLLKCCELFSANYVIGARYAMLDQEFDVSYVKNGTETINTDIDFDGAGLRLGLETERYSCRNQLHLYANGYANVLAGRFRANYFQGQSFDPSVVDVEWEAGRIVPVLDIEAGLGWTSLDGKCRISAGYLVSAWFNSVTTQDYIQAVQTNNFLSLGDTMTFDGLRGQIEYRF